MLIIGGGVSGLSAAHYLLKSGIKEVNILEASNRLGGWVRSIKDPKTGLVFEKGPRTLRVNTPSALNTLSLIEELGIESKIKPVLKSSPASKNRLIYVNNKLHPLPTNFTSIFKKVPPFSKPMFYAIFKDLLTPRKTCTDDNIYDFVNRRFGNDIANYLISSLICGICAGDAKEISVKLLMPVLFEYEQTHGSVLKGMISKIMKESKKKKENVVEEDNLITKATKEQWNVYGLEGGLSILPNALLENITKQGVNVKLDSKVTELSLKEGMVKCKVGNEEIVSDHVFSALAAKHLAPLLSKEHPKLAADLASIPCVTVCVVNLAYKGNVIDYNAFGFLVPPSQKVPLLGVIFDTCSFPQEEWTVLTAMVGGRWFDEQIGKKSEKEILDLVTSQMKTILGVKTDPEGYHISIMKDCIAQYVVGHNEKVQNIFSYIKENKLPITLVGASYKGVGVNDAILSSKTGVEELMKDYKL
ncbi:protoporphyrinogen oxidase [Halyomorpha halys]|uniref:protoporphyrinogen oxidase n=1 Tax=Halyomorpha halys TaxID=286706 RepID=UPI0006D4EF79|nr:protoporphyrinogen oxidase [Halyomorpha halys]XP_014272548.1 protoporphyrinogen oxidase [Halyomorpha halys]XP_024215635.1 protoporphyrinogen oxidase [Halyomorpha halys]